MAKSLQDCLEEVYKKLPEQERAELQDEIDRYTAMGKPEVQAALLAAEGMRDMVAEDLAEIRTKAAEKGWEDPDKPQAAANVDIPANIELAPEPEPSPAPPSPTLIESIAEAIDKDPAPALSEFEAIMLDHNYPEVVFDTPGRRMSFETALVSESMHPSDRFGKSRVFQIAGQDTIGEGVWRIERPYGHLTYFESEGRLVAARSALADFVEALGKRNVKFGADETLLFQTISKDIVNNDLAGMLANETIQNSKDAFPIGNKDSKIAITIDSQYNNKVNETYVEVKDNAGGMTPTEIENAFLKLGAKGKSGTTTSGGYGLAKAGFLLTPRRAYVESVKKGIRTVLQGTREQFFGIEGTGELSMETTEAKGEPSGTTLRMWFYEDSAEANADNAFALDPFEADSAFTKYATQGLYKSGLTTSIKARSKAPRSYVSKPFSSLKPIYKTETVSVIGNNAKVYFVHDPNPSAYTDWTGRYGLHVETFNKGLALFSLAGSKWEVPGLINKPNFKVMVDFSKTTDVQSVNYPFIRNRTDLNRTVREEVAAIVKSRVDKINDDMFEGNKKSFIKMVASSPVINGVKVLVPFKDAEEKKTAIAKIKENPGGVMDDLVNVYKSFQAILDKVGGKTIELAMSVDPGSYGYRSRPDVVGVEIYAINPFLVTKTVVKHSEFANMVKAGHDRLSLMSNNMVHVFVHEYTHNEVRGHSENFTSQMLVNYMKIGHTQLARLEQIIRRFYEKHESSITILQEDFGLMGQGGSELSDSSIAVHTWPGVGGETGGGELPGGGGEGIGDRQAALTSEEGIAAGGLRDTDPIDNITVGEFRDLVLKGTDAQILAEAKAIFAEEGIDAVDRIHPGKIVPRIYKSLLDSGMGKLEAITRSKIAGMKYEPLYKQAQEKAKPAAKLVPPSVSDLVNMDPATMLETFEDSAWSTGDPVDVGFISPSGKPYGIEEGKSHFATIMKAIGTNVPEYLNSELLTHFMDKTGTARVWFHRTGANLDVVSTKPPTNAQYREFGRLLERAKKEMGTTSVFGDIANSRGTVVGSFQLHGPDATISNVRSAVRGIVNGSIKTPDRPNFVLGKPGNVWVRMKNGDRYESDKPIHGMMTEDFPGLNFDDVVESGVVRPKEQGESRAMAKWSNRGGSSPVMTKETQDKLRGSVVTKDGKPWEKPGDELELAHGTPFGNFDESAKAVNKARQDVIEKRKRILQDRLEVYSMFDWKSPPEDRKVGMDMIKELEDEERKLPSIAFYPREEGHVFRYVGTNDHGYLGEGFYFSEDTEVARKWAEFPARARVAGEELKPYIYKAYLALKNPFRVGVSEYTDDMGEVEQKRYNELNRYEKDIDRMLQNRASAKTWMLKKFGYDGVIGETAGRQGVEYLVFDNENIVLPDFTETNISKAQRMYDGGKTDDEVFKATGWVRESTLMAASTKYTDLVPYGFSPRNMRNLGAVARAWRDWMKEAGASPEVLRKIDLELKPMISLEGKMAKASIDQWIARGIDPRTILGVTTVYSMRAVMELAYGLQNLAGMQRSTRHDFWHVAKRWILPEDEIKRIGSFFGNNEEREADAFADYMDESTNPEAKARAAKQPGWLRKLWAKVRRILEIIRNGLRGREYKDAKDKVFRARGFMRPEDVFGKLKNGAYRPHFGRGKGESGIAFEAKPWIPADTTTPEFANFMKGSVATKSMKPWAKPGDEIELYHGTGEAIKEFDKGMSEEGGIFLTPNPHYAVGYTHPGKGSNPSMLQVYSSVKNPIFVRYDQDYPKELMALYATARKNGTRYEEEGLAAGYDGVIWTTSGEWDSASAIEVWKPEAIKSVFNRGSWSQDEANISFMGEPSKSPWSYSALERTIADNMDKVPVKAQAIPNWLVKQGVKPEEMKWLGLDSWLKENQVKGKVDREALLSFVRQNQVKLTEVVRARTPFVPPTKLNWEDSPSQHQGDSDGVMTETPMGMFRVVEDLEGEGTYDIVLYTEGNTYDGEDGEFLGNYPTLDQAKSVVETRVLGQALAPPMGHHPLDEATGVVAPTIQWRGPDHTPGMQALLPPDATFVNSAVMEEGDLYIEYAVAQEPDGTYAAYMYSEDTGINDIAVGLPTEVDAHAAVVESWQSEYEIAQEQEADNQGDQGLDLGVNAVPQDIWLPDADNTAIGDMILDDVAEEGEDSIYYGMTLVRATTEIDNIDGDGMLQFAIAQSQDGSYSVIMLSDSGAGTDLDIDSEDLETVEEAEGRINQLVSHELALVGDEATVLPIGSPKYRTYTVPGPYTNYREIEMILPGSEYYSGHFPEKGLLMHMRTSDRMLADGRKALFVEEVQSDQLQAAKIVGWAKPGARLEPVTGGGIPPNGVPPAPFGPTKETTKAVEGKPVIVRDTGSWPMVAMKRLIRMAAEGDYDVLAWTTGAQQTQIYRSSLHQRVSEIGWDKKDPGLVQLSVITPDGKEDTLSIQLVGEGEIVGYGRVSLDSLLGNEMASQIRNSKEESGSFSGDQLTIGGQGMKEFYDKLLPKRVGAYTSQWGAKREEGQIFGVDSSPEFAKREATRAAYDSFVDSMREKYGDAWPERMTAEERTIDDRLSREIELSGPEPLKGPEVDPVHVLPITPSMRTDALYKGQPMFMAEPGPIPWAYSQASRSVTDAVQSGTLPKKAQSVRNFLIKKGVKPEELDWLGLDDWLAANTKKGQFDPQALLDHVKEHEVQVEEMINFVGGAEGVVQEYISASDYYEEEAERVLMEDWEGKEGETPSDSAIEELAMQMAENAMNHEEGQYSEYQMPGGEDYRELLFLLPDHLTTGKYRSSHWDEPNVLAHVRFNTRSTADGKSVLFLEELQSDWLQDAKKQGFAGTPADPRNPDHIRSNKVPVAPFGPTKESTKPADEEQLAKARNKWADLNDKLERLLLEKQEISEKYPNTDPDDHLKTLPKAEWSPDDRHRELLIVDQIRNTQTELYQAEEMETSAKKTITRNMGIWPEVFFRRMLRYAAENGYDYLAWTPGHVQVERYSGYGDKGLRQFYDEVLPNYARKYTKKWDSEPTTIDISPFEIDADEAGKWRYDMAGTTIRAIEADNFDEAYEKAISTRMELADQTREQAEAYFSKNDDLSSYEELNVPVTIHAVPITPSMRKSVLYEGQSWFNVLKEGESLIKAGSRAEKIKAKLKSAYEEFLVPIQGSPLDAAALAYLRTGDFSDYIGSMPSIGDLKPNEIYRYDPESKDLIAGIKSKPRKGKRTIEKPALRASGFFALQSFHDATEGYTDISKRMNMWTDPTRLIQAIDQGFFGGPVQTHVLWPARSTTIAKLRYADRMKTRIATDLADKYDIHSGKKARAVGEIIEHISSVDAWMKPISEVLALPKVKKSLESFPAKYRSDLVGAAVEARKIFDTMMANINAAREARNQPIIPERAFYLPHIIADNLWSRLAGLKRRPADIMDSPEMPDFIKPNKPFNARAMAREGGMKDYPLERNIIRLLADYVETAARDIFDTNIVHNNKIHAAVLRAHNLLNAADQLDSWTAEAFAGVSPPITRVVRQIIPDVALRQAHRVRRNLTRAVFPLNLSWNLFVQTSSAGITVARYGPTASLAGLGYLSNPATNQIVKHMAYSQIVKSRWGGNPAYQDMQSSLLRNKHLEGSHLDTLENALNFTTSAIESALTGHAVAAALYHGRHVLGLTGRELMEYAGEGGAKTQSMYNFQDLPGLLRNKEVGVMVPFQTFCFEVFNTVRELNVPVLRKYIGKTGIYQTMNANSKSGKALLSKRLKMILTAAAAIVVTNAVTQRAIGRKVWTPTSFIPFLGYAVGNIPIVSKYLGGTGGKGPVPEQYVSDFIKGISDITVHGDWRRFRRWVLRYQVLAGTQVERTWSGIEAVARGGRITDVKGKTVFRIDPSDYPRAIVSGPYSTGPGQAYLAKKKGEGPRQTRRSATQHIRTLSK